MRALLQRVQSASVNIENAGSRSIGRGLTVLLGIAPADTEKDALWLSEKILNLRLFPKAWAAAPEEGKGHPARADAEDGLPAGRGASSGFDLSVKDIGGEVLVVSQFTLYADVRKGRRPDFTGAALPDRARSLYLYFVNCLQQAFPRTVTGEFGAAMRVDIHNQGPVTILVDSQEGTGPKPPPVPPA